jgi:hypothetical protein
MLVAAISGVASAALVLTAGYLLGARHGARARERLWQQCLDLAESLRHERQILIEQREAMRADEHRNDLGSLIDLLLKQGEAMQHMLEPLARRAVEDDKLRDTVEQVLTPLLQRERLEMELTNLETAKGDRSSLTRLLDQISDKGRFRVVVLTDDEGLPLATSTNAWDVDRLAGVSAHVSMLADRLGREGAPAPLSVMVHDEGNQVTLCRIFRVRNKRLILTAVSHSAELTSSALDPALTKVDAALSRPLTG